MSQSPLAQQIDKQLSSKIATEAEASIKIAVLMQRVERGIESYIKELGYGEEYAVTQAQGFATQYPQIIERAITSGVTEKAKKLAREKGLVMDITPQLTISHTRLAEHMEEQLPDIMDAVKERYRLLSEQKDTPEMLSRSMDRVDE